MKNINMVLLMGVFTFSAGLTQASSVTIPNTFTAGSTAVAADVNANFNALETAVDDNDARISTLESGPQVTLIDGSPGAISVPTSASLSTPVCVTPDIAPTSNKTAFIDSVLSIQETTQETVAGVPSYSIDGGTTWNTLNNWYAFTSNPAGGWLSSPSIASLSLAAGTTYRFGILYTSTTGAFTATNSRCRIRVVTH